MEILNQFGINPILLAAQVVNFLILLFILKKFLYRPILKILEKRKELVVKTLKNAEESEKIYREASEKADQIIANAAEESKKILDETKKMGAQVLEEYNKAGAEILQRANVQAIEVIKADKVVFETEMKKHLGDLVVLAFEKVTGKRLTEKDRMEVVEKEVRNLS